MPRVRKRSTLGTRKVPPSFSRFPLFPFFPFSRPSPVDPCDTTHQSPGSNSSSQSPNSVTWLTVPPMPPSAQGIYRVCPAKGGDPLRQYSSLAGNHPQSASSASD